MDANKFKTYFLKLRRFRKAVFITIMTVIFIIVVILLARLFAMPNPVFNNNTHDDLKKYNFYDNQNKLGMLSFDELNISEHFKKLNENSNGNIKKAGPMANLSEIIANAESGQVIELEQGIYNINLEINKNIIILGHGKDTILHAENPEKAIININNSEFALKNLTLQGSCLKLRRSGLADAAKIGIEAYNSKATITNVKFIDFAATACYAKDSNFNFIDSYIYDSNSALKLLNSEGKITGSIIKNNRKSGIQLLGSNFIIHRNIIMDNESYGIFLDVNSEADIKNNCIKGNNGYNVRIEKSMEIYR